MAQYFYVIDTSITNDAGVAVGQTTYDLLVNERKQHGVIPASRTVGFWREMDGSTPAPDDVSAGITTNRSVRVNNDLTVIRNLDIDGRTELDITNIAETLNVVGLSTFTSHVQIDGRLESNGGLVEKFEKAGTTLGNQTNNPLSDGNAILFTGNESGNLTINFTGVHSVLGDGDSVTFNAVISPNNSGRINAVQIDGATPANLYWPGGSAPSASSSGRDFYTFVIFKTGTGTTNYEVYGSVRNFS
tara:strand:+ start:345 stop:1079 length:735 start_codon:yes stop_codon:yes gene_type:complete